MDNHCVPVSSIAYMLCLSLFIKFIVCSDHPAYLPGDVSINCGSVGTFAARNGRQWLGDTDPIFASSLQIKGKSTISSAAGNSVSADPIPYKTARISSSGFSYVFLVNPGEKFIRLHFNPTPHKGFQKYKDLFTVEAGPFTLLSNFSASLTADVLGLSSIIKEFCISIEENQPLHIVFTPIVSQSGDTFAFLNGIEIITVPSGHSYFHDDGDIRAQVVGHKSRQIYVDNSTALEMVRRVNIKWDGDEIRDKFGMWGTVLREKANQINNIEWKIPVDVGFRYLIRLHFSYLGLKLVQENGSANFVVLINGVNTYNNIDLVRERDIYNIIVHKDYMVMLKGQKHRFKHDIVVSLRSYHEFFYGYGPFTGFEILKLSNLDNSLACPNPLPPAHDSSSSIVHTLLSVCGNRNVIVFISITIIALANIIIHKLREIWESSCTEEENKPSARAERFCRRFSLAEVKLATNNFSYHLIIGKGGFGQVYKGLIDHGKETVAIKRLKAHSSQGAHEFLTEIETLSELRHFNLVSLIGYCNEQGEMILVYEYMAGGTLGDHLYKLSREGSSCTSLAWKQRLNICIGAGRGLDYLHTGHGVIHRDVKSSNILLDENFTAKVSDFGLVKQENLSKLQTHVSTKVKGTFGYLDPTYSNTGKLTRKSDIYAFGLVLLEVLCGRPAIDQRVSETEQILTKWARDKLREGEVELIVDSNLKQEISPNSLKAFVEIVERCLDDEPKKRPTMAQVVLQLESSLEQQDIVESSVDSVPKETTNIVESSVDSVPKEITNDASCTDETNLSVGEQDTWFDERIPTPPPKVQTNDQIDSDDLSYRRKKGRKVSSYKPPRIWSWDAIWKRVKPSRKNENSISEICEEYIKLPKYDWSMIESATDHFSTSNRVGGSLDGPSYYKAVFRSGQIVVVKILSASGSRRHARYFIKEILKVQNLHHRNILKLLGYCIHKEKMVLVHEFMENKSLDKFIFEGKFEHLPCTWTQRFKIIMGIARGLVYLHEDSGMRIILGYLKPSHILLDANMNPKISGFDSARTMEEYFETDNINTSGIVGYISPDCYLHGKFSVMTDVYSFGVVVLEIVSGRRCVSKCQHIVAVALDLWKKCEALELMDKSIQHDVLIPVEDEEEEVLRCIKVGLLCTQNHTEFRPTMASVIKLLEGELTMELQDQWRTKNL